MDGPIIRRVAMADAVSALGFLRIQTPEVVEVYWVPPALTMAGTNLPRHDQALPAGFEITQFRVNAPINRDDCSVSPRRDVQAANETTQQHCLSDRWGCVDVSRKQRRRRITDFARVTYGFQPLGRWNG